MGSASAHDAQRAAGAVYTADLNPNPPNRMAVWPSGIAQALLRCLAPQPMEQSQKKVGAEGWGPEGFWPRRVGNRRVGLRRVGRLKISRFFFPLPLPFSLFLSLSGVFSWNFGGV